MKRNEALIPLSREHHTALILAQLLKKNVPDYKGLPANVDEKVIYAMNMYHTSLKEHFRKEEVLLEKVQHCHEDIKNIGKDIVAEHLQLTALFLGLDKTQDAADSMNSLGNALDKHIRKEERVLFPLIQKYCSEELKELGSLFSIILFVS